MNDENLDLLDLDDTEESVDDTLPEATAYAAPRPHRPWLLMGIGIAVIVLAVFVIIRVVGSNSSSSMEVDLGAPIVVEERPVEIIGADAAQPVVAEPVPVANVMPNPKVAPDAGRVAPVVQPQPVAQNVQVATQQPVNAEPSVRVIQDRKEVKFNPQQETAAPKPVPVAAPKTVKTATKPKAVAKPAPKTATKTTQKVANGGWYVQFGSYGTREAAAAAEKKIRAGHASLFQGKQFVILAAVLPNGQTTYRLRIAFASSNDASGFCQNAKSDGLDCYVAK